ncbi:MAG: Gfo/Idh/MocA family oxidoreductase, partial [Muribaculaceae bacterium]|nr:Gfo/Idh/MocA family oxidoreductase [Muribaculaceae bacterium]
PGRLKKMAEAPQVDPKYRFSDWADALSAGKIADAVVISLPDDVHYEPCMKALDMGYHILLEKPVAPTRKECEDIRDLANRKGAIVAVCHVLRYAPYFVALKKVVDSGMIGKLMSIQHFEPIRYAHMAHSYVRGNWHNSKKTTPIILAKSCHDLDIIRWIVGSPCRSISAYGSLSFFTHANRPAGATARCTDGCPHEDSCPYSAIDIYTRKHQHTYVFDNLPPKGPSRERAIIEQLKTTDYGRCVFDMDNDQCDHYVASMEFENGVTAAFSMEAFTAKGGRRTRIMGTHGMIEGDMEKFTISDFRSGEVQEWSAKDVVEVAEYAGHGHGGGDLCLSRDFVEAVGNNDPGRLTSSIDVSTESHVMGFCAEDSRLQNKKVRVS